MAKLGFDYQVDTDTDKQGGGGGILPHMNALIWVETATVSPTKDNRGTQVELTFEVQEPVEFKGRKFWAYWTVAHSDGFSYGAYKYGKPMFDRLVRATGNDADEFSRDPDTDHIMFKTFTAEIGIQIGNKKNDGSGEFYKDKNQIEKFFYADGSAKDPIPELGVIGDGTQGKIRNEDAAPARPANDNRQAARPAAQQQAAAGGAKKRPW